MKFGERDLESALVWDKVPQANYTQTNSYENFSDVIYNSKQRISSSSNFQLINEYAKWLKKNQDETSYSLNYKKFFEESEVKEVEAKKFKSVFDYKSDLTFLSPKYEQILLKADNSLADKRISWHKNLSKDMYISEALNVISELKLRDKSTIIKN
jgi:carboxyl-terminal processing protease